MQMQARLAEARPVAVDVVADDGIALRRAMHAQLMGTAGERRECQPRQAIAAPHHVPARFGWQAVRIGLLPPAAFGIESPERYVDFAFIFHGAAFDNGPVGLADLAVLEQKPERRGGLAMAAKHEAAGGI